MTLRLANDVIINSGVTEKKLFECYQKNSPVKIVIFIVIVLRGSVVVEGAVDTLYIVGFREMSGLSSFKDF